LPHAFLLKVNERRLITRIVVGRDGRGSEQCAFWLPPFLAETCRIGLHKRYGRSHLADKIVSAYIDCAGDFNLPCNGRVFEQAKFAFESGAVWWQ
jgi:hypothetical protein